MFVATSFCRALNKSIYLSSCPATGCSIAMNLEQMVGQTASHLKSAEWLGAIAADFWRGGKFLAARRHSGMFHRGGVQGDRRVGSLPPNRPRRMRSVVSRSLKHIFFFLFIFSNLGIIWVVWGRWRDYRGIRRTAAVRAILTVKMPTDPIIIIAGIRRRHSRRHHEQDRQSRRHGGRDRRLDRAGLRPDLRLLRRAARLSQRRAGLARRSYSNGKSRPSAALPKRMLRAL